MAPGQDVEGEEEGTGCRALANGLDLELGRMKVAESN